MQERLPSNPTHPLNATLIHHKYLSFCKELTDYILDADTPVASILISEIDDALKATHLHLLYTLYGGPKVKENLGDSKTLWEDRSLFEYEAIMDPGSAYRRRVRGSWVSEGEGQTKGAIHENSGLAVNIEERNIEEENDTYSDTINSTPSNKTPSLSPTTQTLIGFLRSTSPSQRFPPSRKPSTNDNRNFHQESIPGTPSGSKHKRFWRRYKDTEKGKRTHQKKLSTMSDGDRYGLIAPENRAQDEGTCDLRAIAKHQENTRQTSPANTRQHLDRLPSLPQLHDPKIAANHHDSADWDMQSKATESLALTEQYEKRRGDRQTLYGVPEDDDDEEELEAQRHGIIRDFQQRCQPIMENKTIREIEIATMEPGRREAALETLEKSVKWAYRNAARKSGYADVDDDEMMRQVMLLAKQLEKQQQRQQQPPPQEKPLPAPPPPPKSKVKSFLSASGKALEWFLAIPNNNDEDDVYSDSVYLPYASIDMFPLALAPRPKVSTSTSTSEAVDSSTAGLSSSSLLSSSAGVASRKSASWAMIDGGGRPEPSFVSTLWPR